VKAEFTGGTTRLVETLWLVVVLVVDDLTELVVELVVELEGPLPRKRYNPPAATTTTKITAPTITGLETAEDFIRNYELVLRGQ